MIPCAELTYIIGCIPTASSASLHMRLNMVGPLRGPITTNANTPKLRMNPRRPSIATLPAVVCMTVSNASAHRTVPNEARRRIRYLPFAATGKRVWRVFGAK